MQGRTIWIGCRSRVGSGTGGIVSGGWPMQSRSVGIRRRPGGAGVGAAGTCLVLAMQHRLVVVGIEAVVRNGFWGSLFFRGQRFPQTVANPGALLLAGSPDVVEAERGAVLLEFVFNFACQRERLGPGEVDSAILKGLSVIDRDGNNTTGLGFAFVPRPLEDCDGS